MNDWFELSPISVRAARLASFSTVRPSTSRVSMMLRVRRPSLVPPSVTARPCRVSAICCWTLRSLHPRLGASRSGPEGRSAIPGRASAAPMMRTDRLVRPLIRSYAIRASASNATAGDSPRRFIRRNDSARTAPVRSIARIPMKSTLISSPSAATVPSATTSGMPGRPTRWAVGAGSSLIRSRSIRRATRAEIVALVSPVASASPARERGFSVPAAATLEKTRQRLWARSDFWPTRVMLSGCASLGWRACPVTVVLGLCVRRIADIAYTYYRTPGRKAIRLAAGSKYDPVAGPRPAPGGPGFDTS